MKRRSTQLNDFDSYEEGLMGMIMTVLWIYFDSLEEGYIRIVYTATKKGRWVLL